MIRALTQNEMTDLMAGDAEAGFGAIDTEKGCLPLRALDVDVRVEGLTASTTVRQQFANVFDEQLEATYIFPLPPRAAVVGFTMTVAGVTVRGRIDERAQARRDYDTAIARGQRAAIAEEERPDVFTLRVGNIPPRSIACVEFTLVAPVTIDSLEATYRFPLVVAPRYCPGTPLEGEPVGDGIAADTDLVPDGSRISPPILLPGMASPVRLGIRVAVAASVFGGGAAAGGGEFGCSLPAEEARDDAGTRIVRVVPEQRLDRDFILRWKVGDATAAVTTAVAEADATRPAGLGTGAAVPDAAGDGTFAVTIVPPAAAAARQAPRDVVVLLDRSGSMGGWAIVAARRAVARLIDSLTESDRLAVLAFDSTVERRDAAAGLEWATDRGRWQMLEWLATVEARGGTELAAALSAGLELLNGAPQIGTAADCRRERCVVLVTDGQVADEDRVLRALQSRLGDARLFVVGIDNAVNEGLLARLADASGGLVELVESEDRLDEVMHRINARIAPPLITRLGIEGEGIEIVPGSVVPSRIPDLVSGLPVVLRGRYRGVSAGARILVGGVAAEGGSWRTAATLAPAVAAGQGCLWARGRLRHLEDQLILAHHGRGDTDLAQRIVALSTSFGVLCRFTALVAIDDRTPDVDLHQASPRRIVQPVETLCCLSPAAMAAPPQSWLMSTSSFANRVFCEIDADAFDGFDLGGSAAPGDLPVTVLDDLRATALRLIDEAKPASGSIDDMTPESVDRLLDAVRKLVQSVVDVAGPGCRQEAILAVFAREVTAAPSDRVAIGRLLDALADFVEEDGQPKVVRWWTAADARVG